MMIVVSVQNCFLASKSRIGFFFFEYRELYYLIAEMELDYWLNVVDLLHTTLSGLLELRSRILTKKTVFVSTAVHFVLFNTILLWSSFCVRISVVIWSLSTWAYFVIKHDSVAKIKKLLVSVNPVSGISFNLSMFLVRSLNNKSQLL